MERKDSEFGLVYVGLRDHMMFRWQCEERLRREASAVNEFTQGESKIQWKRCFRWSPEPRTSSLLTFLSFKNG